MLKQKYLYLFVTFAINLTCTVLVYELVQFYIIPVTHFPSFRFIGGATKSIHAATMKYVDENIKNFFKLLMKTSLLRAHYCYRDGWYKPAYSCEKFTHAYNKYINALLRSRLPSNSNSHIFV